MCPHMCPQGDLKWLYRRKARKSPKPRAEGSSPSAPAIKKSENVLFRTFIFLSGLLNTVIYMFLLIRKLPTFIIGSYYYSFKKLNIWCSVLFFAFDY